MVGTLAVLFVGLKGRTMSAQIVYTESDTASGSLGGVQFTNVLVTFTANANTSGVGPYPGVAGVLGVDNTSAAVSVAGFGEATFTLPTLTYVRQVAGQFNPVRVGLEEGTLTSTGLDIIDVSNPVLATYDLTSAIGPLTGGVSGGGAGTLSFGTTAGDLIIDSFTPNAATFQASLVPEPSSLLTLTLGIAGASFGLLRRRMKRRAAKGNPPAS